MCATRALHTVLPLMCISVVSGVSADIVQWQRSWVAALIAVFVGDGRPTEGVLGVNQQHLPR